MSAHILMLSHTGFGHVNPQLPLAQELIRRGHQVTFISSPKFYEVITRTGANYIERNQSPAPAGHGITAQARAERFSHNLIEEARTDLAVVEQLVADHTAHGCAHAFDAVAFGTFSFAGPVIGSRYNIPQIQLWASAVTPLPGSGLTPTLADGERIFTHITDEFFSSYGLDFQPSSTLSDHNLAFYPRFFQPGGDEYRDNFHFIGPSIPRQDNKNNNPHSELIKQVKSDPRPLIFIALGSNSHQRVDFYRNCITALNDEKYQVIMSIGNLISVDMLTPIPSNFTIAPFFPQLALLEYTDVFVTHGGMNSCMESLYFQVPTVLFPQQDEQGFNAQQLVKLGVGELLGENYHPDNLRRTIDLVHSQPSYRIAAQDYGLRTRNCGGVTAGVDLIEKILG